MRLVFQHFQVPVLGTTGSLPRAGSNRGSQVLEPIGPVSCCHSTFTRGIEKKLVKPQ